MASASLSGLSFNTVIDQSENKFLIHHVLSQSPRPQFWDWLPLTSLATQSRSNGRNRRKTVACLSDTTWWSTWRAAETSRARPLSTASAIWNQRPTTGSPSGPTTARRRGPRRRFRLKPRNSVSKLPARRKVEVKFTSCNVAHNKKMLRCVLPLGKLHRVTRLYVLAALLTPAIAPKVYPAIGRANVLPKLLLVWKLATFFCIFLFFVLFCFV